LKHCERPIERLPSFGQQSNHIGAQIPTRGAIKTST
jgi:hypothetical protein